MRTTSGLSNPSDDTQAAGGSVGSTVTQKETILFAVEKDSPRVTPSLGAALDSDR